jgi:glucokinase
MAAMTKNDQPLAAVVGDIGGTNARFALADLSDAARPTISDSVHLPSADFDSLKSALAEYLKRVTPETTPRAAVIDVAGPVADGEAKLTNLPWHVSEAALMEFGFAKAHLVNDFRALAAAADLLGDDELDPIGPTLPRAADATIAIVGAGTGFGTSALVREKNTVIAAAGEGGHIGFAPEDDIEIEILRLLARRFGRVSVERIVSGPGLVHLYEALCEIAGTRPRFSEPPQILDEAKRAQGTAREAVERFCAIFGAAAGDIALVYGARGGVLIAGGLSEAMAPFLKSCDFRTRFEGKGRLAHFVRQIPTHLITHPDAALLGCARLAQAL